MLQLLKLKQTKIGDYMNTKRLISLSLFLSMAIVLSIVESFIPSISVPGAKLGLANIITLVVLNIYGEKDAFLVVILRIVLVGLLRGITIGFFLSLSGGVFAFLLMVLFKRFKIFSIISISVMGSLGHSVGQIAMAIIILKTPQLVYYLPWVFLIAIPTGIFTGLVAKKFTEISKKAILI
jgi:heptaprenyl diphosphate synthase